jgi:sugar lactone lactonase YvrE
MNFDVRVLIDARASLGEGPRWHAEERRLYWVDIDRCELHCTDPVNGTDAVRTFNDPVGCFAFRAGGGLILAMKDGAALIDHWDDEPRPFGPQFMAGRPHHRFNDGCTDAQGRFWVGNLTKDKANPDAVLVRYDADGRMHEMLGGMTTCNGAAFSADGRFFYHSDTPTHAVRRFAVDPDGGTLGPPTLLHQFPHGHGRPDGGCFDVDGYYWCALFDGGRVVRIAPDGRIDRSIAVPATRPTMIALGGDDFRTAFVTSATTGLDAAALAREPHAGALFTFRVDVPGFPIPPFAG